MKARTLLALAKAAAMNIHHKRALAVLLSVTLLDVFAGIALALTESVPVWHGVYCTIGLTTTDGCDIPLHGGLAYALSALAMILFVPLWATAFSFFTTGLTADHVDRKTDRQTQELKEHLPS